MKKSSLITVALASLVALVGCNKPKPKPGPQPDDRPLSQRLAEEFIKMGFGEEAVEEVEEVTVEDLEENYGVAVFQYWFASSVTPVFGTNLFRGHQYFGNFLTPADAAEVYTAADLFEELFEGTEEQPALLADWEETMEDIAEDFNGVTRTYIAPAYSSEYGQGSGLWGVISYDDLGRFTAQVGVGFGMFDTTYSLADYEEEYPSKTEAECEAEFAELLEQYKHNDEDELYLVFFEFGAAYLEEEVYGDGYSVDEVVEEINENLSATGLAFAYDEASQSWKIAAAVGNSTDESEENLLSAITLLASYFPTYLELVNDPNYTWYGDPDADDYYDLFGDQSVYYFATYKTSDNSVTATLVSYVYNGRLVVQATIK